MTWCVDAGLYIVDLTKQRLPEDYLGSGHCSSENRRSVLNVQMQIDLCITVLCTKESA